MFRIASIVFLSASMTIAQTSQPTSQPDIATLVYQMLKNGNATTAPAPTRAPAVAAAPLAVQHPSKPVFTIQGMKMGDTLSKEFIHKHCSTIDLPEYGGDPKEIDDEILAEGGQIQVHYQVEKFKLIGVTMSFQSRLFEKLVRIYTDKLGKPIDVRTSTVKTRAGVEYENIEITWDTLDGYFFLFKYGSSIEKGNAALMTKAYEDRIDKRKKAEADDLKKKL